MSHITLKANLKTYNKYNIFIFFSYKEITNRLLVRLTLCSALSKWIHKKIRLPLTILTCLKRLNRADYLFINTRTFSVSATQTHTHKNKLVMSGCFIRRFLHPSLNDRKLLFAGIVNAACPPRSPFVSHASTGYCRGLQILSDKLCPSLRCSGSCVCLASLGFVLCDFPREGITHSRRASLFPTGHNQSCCTYVRSDLCAPGSVFKRLCTLKKISVQGVIYVASLD